MTTRPGLLDTSVLIAGESGRPLAVEQIPTQTAVGGPTVIRV